MMVNDVPVGIVVVRRGKKGKKKQRHEETKE
jgi:hypothetical protein